MNDHSTRWASFDCYGTLIDWNRGIRAQLARIFGEHDSGRHLLRYHQLEPHIEHQHPAISYRQVMQTVLSRLADEENRKLPEHESDALARSVPCWPAFPEVRTALEDARRRGWRLAILSNTDRDLIDASIKQINVAFELAIVASEIGSYKPAPGHWEAFFTQTAADRSLHVHIGASLYHDIHPARTLGIKSIWINRLAEHANEKPTRELPTLSGLGETLDELAQEAETAPSSARNPTQSVVATDAERWCHKHASEKDPWLAHPRRSAERVPGAGGLSRPASRPTGG